MILNIFVIQFCYFYWKSYAYLANKEILFLFYILALFKIAVEIHIYVFFSFIYC